MGTLNVTELGPEAEWTKIRTGLVAADAAAVATSACLQCRGPFVDFLVRGTWNSKTITAQVRESSSVPTGANVSYAVENGFVDGEDTHDLTDDTILPLCKGRGYMTLYLTGEDWDGVTLEVWARPS